MSDSETLWTVAHKAPLSVGFSTQEYWSGLPCPLPGDLPNPGIEPTSLVLQVDGKPLFYICLQAKLHQLCPTLCDPMDYSPPDSSVHGILLARILERVAMPSSWGSSQPKDQTHFSCVSCIAGGFLYCLFTRTNKKHLEKSNYEFI